MLPVSLLLVVLCAEAPAPASVLVLPLHARGDVAQSTADLVTGMLVQELRRQADLRVVSMREVEGTLSQDMQRQVAGCDTAGCAAEIASALNTDRIVMGELGNVGDNLVLTASMVEARSGRVLGSGARRVKGQG